MIKGLYTFIVIIVSFIPGYCQTGPGARQIALSNSDVALSDDVFSVFNNPAGLSQLNWREVGIYYSPAPFGIKELSNAYLCYNEPSRLGSFGFGVMTYGFNLYRENNIILSYSNFYKDFYFGLAAKYYMLSIENYGQAKTLMFNIGGLIYIRDDTKWGIYFDNISRSTIGSSKSQLPYSFKTGLSYSPVIEMQVNTSAEKINGYEYSLSLGLEYNLFRHLYIRSGFSTQPDRFSAGVGINYSYFQFDYAVFTHMDLGLTHQAGFIIHFSDDEPRALKIKRVRLNEE